MRIFHLTDTHLSADQAHFFGNFEAVRHDIAAHRPDLVINTGDISVNGADSAADLRFAAFCHRRIAAPLKVIPGNHDIGEEPGAVQLDQPTTQARVARYRCVFGPDWWSMEAPGWRLVGLDCLLFGTGLPDEHAQWAWFAQACAQLRGAALALFIHKPLCLNALDEPAALDFCVSPAARERLLALAGPALRVVASGHLHQGRLREIAGVAHLWGPSTAFPAGAPHTPDADPRPGYALLDLRPNQTFEARLVHPDRLVAHDYQALKEHGRYQYLKDIPPGPSPIEPWG